MRNTSSCGYNVNGDYFRYLYIGFTLVLIAVVLTAVGLLVDTMLGTLPLFLLVGVGLGFGSGLYYVYLQIEKMGSG